MLWIRRKNPLDVIFDATIRDRTANQLSAFRGNRNANGYKTEFMQQTYFYLLLSNVKYILNLYVYMENKY